MNVRGQILFKAFAKLHIALANVGSVPIVRGRGLGLIVDLIYLSTSLAREVVCQLREYFIHSDHQAIFSTLEKEETAVWRP